MHFFPKTDAEVVKKRTSNMKVYYIIPLNYWTQILDHQNGKLMRGQFMKKSR